MRRLPFILAFATAILPSRAGSPACRNAVLADNPVAYWQLDEASGPLAADAALPAQNGTCENVALGQPSAFPALGTCGLFNGTSSRVRIAAAPEASPDRATR